MSIKQEKIIWTKVDEAPALASYSLLPIVKAFTSAAGVIVEIRDISLAGRILARFPELLTEAQRVSDDLAVLGDMVKRPEANIIKLPCISASVAQLKAAIRELQEQGYRLPDYPEKPATPKGQEYRERYDRVKGSAVNPVLREGNSDRRIPPSVKDYARKHPHAMGSWTPDNKAHVATMSCGDFRNNELSTTIDRENAGHCRIEMHAEDGRVTVLKPSIPLLEDEIIDITRMDRNALRAFIAEQIEDAKARDVLFSVHLKATMMKVSDPIIFGHVISVFFADVFHKHAQTFKRLGVNPNNGLAELYAKIAILPEEQRAEIEADIQAVYEKRPKLAMVDSEKGITNLHVPSDVIIDASMPRMIRESGSMWGPDGKQHQAKAVIPDSSYAGVYQAVIDHCKHHGAFDPRTMGTVPNVGLMAQKAEEYGSHDKTFEIPANGVVKVVSSSGCVLLEMPVAEGDIFRMCQTKDLPVQDWVKLAVNRARATGWTTVFWLDRERAHDAELICKVQTYLQRHDTSGLEIKILPPAEAAKFTCERISKGENVISVTGNVLRDYLTDLFPILEVGTSAKMLSIVPLMKGGGLFETGAGGSAPKHVQQFQREGHLRWDSLGEFLALAASLEHLATRFDNPKARVLANTLDKANGLYLENDRSPGRKVGELDTRGSHFYLAMYWAQELARQNDTPEMQGEFVPVAQALAAKEEDIVAELNAAQGKPQAYGGYYHPDDKQASRLMRPSQTFNAIIDTLMKQA